MTRIGIVGGGFGGVAAAAMLTRAGYRDVTIFERRERVGGVWDANRYPGVACDIPSHLYELSFAPNPGWSRSYATGAEIQAYIERVLAAEGLSDRVCTRTEVTDASWDEARSVWTLTTRAAAEGDPARSVDHEFDVMIAACGQLRDPQMPNLPGAGEFSGRAFHTAEWPDDFDLGGSRVALIGTGASAIQVASPIADQATSLTIYQRTPTWLLPRLDYPYPAPIRRVFATFPAIQRADRRFVLGIVEALGVAWTRAPRARRALQWSAKARLRLAVRDRALRSALTPSYEIGCKRVVFSNDWYRTVQRPDVELVTQPVASLSADGITTADGVTRRADVLVYATGFHSHRFVAPMRIAGAGGITLTEAWAERPRAYLGITVPQFPNMFLLYGPNTNSGAGSVIYTIEAAVRHVIAALDQLRARHAVAITVHRDAADRFDRELQTALKGTVYHTGCASWYLDEHGNDPSQWPWSWSTYARRTGVLTEDDYQVFSAP